MLWNTSRFQCLITFENKTLTYSVNELQSSIIPQGNALDYVVHADQSITNDPPLIYSEDP